MFWNDCDKSWELPTLELRHIVSYVFRHIFETGTWLPLSCFEQFVFALLSMFVLFIGFVRLIIVRYLNSYSWDWTSVKLLLFGYELCFVSELLIILNSEIQNVWILLENTLYQYGIYDVFVAFKMVCLWYLIFKINVSNLVLTLYDTGQFKCRENVAVTRRDLLPTVLFSRKVWL